MVNLLCGFGKAESFCLNAEILETIEPPLDFASDGLDVKI